MRIPRAVLAVALATVCWCCATGTAGRTATVRRLEAVQPGMTAQQVEDAVGPPRMIDAHGGRARTEAWHYDDGIVILDGGRVTYRFLKSMPRT